MRVTVPDYFENFQCLAGECPHTCCEKWEVVIDADSAERYMSVPGALGDKLRSALKRDEDGDLCFPLEGGRCPFLDGDNLCEIHKKLGEAATSVTCREHPRFTEDYGTFREVTLSASCPAANCLLLGSEVPLTFRTFETAEAKEIPGPPQWETEQSDGEDEWLTYLLPLRQRMLGILTDRSRPLKARMASFLALALAAQGCLDEDCPEALPQAEETGLPPVEEGVFPGALRLLASLEVLDPDWRDLLRQAEAAEPDAAPEVLLERIAVYFAFRYLLKAVNDGDLLGRAKLCVLAVLVVERLAAVCGLAEGLRRFSCEIEHDDGNLDALLEAFRWEEALSPGAFLVELRR